MRETGDWEDGARARERERDREQDALVEGAVEMTRVGGVVAVRDIPAEVIGPGKEIIHSRLALRPLCSAIGARKRGWHLHVVVALEPTPKG